MALVDLRRDYIIKLYFLCSHKTNYIKHIRRHRHAVKTLHQPITCPKRETTTTYESPCFLFQFPGTQGFYHGQQFPVRLEPQSVSPNRNHFRTHRTVGTGTDLEKYFIWGTKYVYITNLKYVYKFYYITIAKGFYNMYVLRNTNYFKDIYFTFLIYFI